MQYKDKYDCLLLYFLEDIEFLDPSELNDFSTITRFVKESTPIGVKMALDQGLEICILEDFPDDWIRRTSNRYFENKLARKKWIKWVVDTLEQEAKKQGKLQIEIAKG